MIADCASAEASSRAAVALRKEKPSELPMATWEYGGHSYALYGASFKGWLTWLQSKTFCEKLGGHLITLGSQGEQNALAEAMDRASVRAVFTGLSGSWPKNQWAWVTGEPMTFRSFRKIDGKEVYGHMGKRGGIFAPHGVPEGPHEPVRFATQPTPGWYVDDKPIDAFVCEWEQPGAAQQQAAPRTRVATHGQYVLMQSFDDLVGETILRKATAP
jgi:hypothetical protein